MSKSHNLIVRTYTTKENPQSIKKGGYPYHTNSIAEVLCLSCSTAGVPYLSLQLITAATR